ncbi:TonB-dependent receptor [Sulfurimonas aquatica]|uniref:TonB-dependent receptor n=1 Tax=Sulfurimonas aquatica TaxID=2672570 RepID=A0A975GCV9_9BACT|nr:TonB-dependent receptor [Sulfurimonas aquatica]QSZ42035.1 TonB-dependent receptor [Sulfurimonas aquatica]
MINRLSLSIITTMLLSIGAGATDIDELLDLDLEELSNIEITTVFGPSKTTQKITDAPANITVITSQEIKTRNYRSLAEALSTQSGFYTSYDRDYTYLGVRGFSSPGDYNSKILTLIDGQRVNENIYSSSMVGPVTHIDMDLIDYIEVIRGPGSAIYGSSALFAVINIVTKSAQKFQNGEASLMVGNYGTDQERVTLSHLFDSGNGLLLSATRFHSDGDNDLYFKEFDDPTTNGGHAKNIDSTDGYTLFLKSNISDFKIEALMYSREKTVPTAAWESIFNEAIISKDRHGYVNLAYKHSFSDELKISTSLAYNYYDFIGDYIYEDGGLTLSRDEARAQWIDGNVDVNYKQSDSLDWLLGLYLMESLEEKQVYLYDNVTDIDTDNPINYYAFYLQNIYKPTEDLSFTLGLRYDNYETIGSQISPKASLIYSFSPVSSLKLIYGEAFRAPNSYELYYNDGDFTSKANPNLKEENIKNYEIVLEHYFSTNHSFIVNGFYYEMQNLIQQTTDASGILFFDNLDKTESKGLELSHKFMFTNGIKSSLNYTYQETTNKETGVVLVNSPKDLANAVVTIPFLSNYSTFFALQYVGEKKNPNGDILDDYTLMNLGLNAYDVVKGLDFSGTLYNLFDTSYSSSGGEEHAQKEIIQDGITFRVKATYKF